MLFSNLQNIFFRKVVICLIFFTFKRFLTVTSANFKPNKLVLRANPAYCNLLFAKRPIKGFPLLSGLKPEYETTLVFAVCLWSMLLFSQAKVKDTVTRRASINYNQKGISFLSNQNPPLIPIAGAPKPSYSIYGN
jgi:hypothetical protein